MEQVAFVTGGSGDIGKAIAQALAGAGIDVVVSYVGDAGRAKRGGRGGPEDRPAGLRRAGSRSTRSQIDRCLRRKGDRAGSGGSISSSTMRRGISAFRSLTSRR